MKASELTVDDLEKIIDTDSFPEGLTLEGIEDHPDFELLFKHRSHPSLFAKTLLKRVVSYGSDLKTRQDLQKARTALKAKELMIREQKLRTQSVSWEKVLEELKEQGLLLRRILNILERRD